jgi:hypothetical protein
MIRIVRGIEPAQLVDIRSTKLAGAREAQGLGATIDFAGYGAVKSELAEMQNNKCCYCEDRPQQPKFRDVEHYRPKALYWWLAWTWENLLYSCTDCNREWKRSQFPLDNEGMRLIAEDIPPGAEHPLILDPSDPAIDPLDEIRFLPEKAARERWVPRGVSPRGQRTIDVCGLDRPPLLDFYTAHVVDFVRPRLAPFFSAQKVNDTKSAFRAWNTATRALLAPGQRFRALSHDALNRLVLPTVRDSLNLELPRPVAC